MPGRSRGRWSKDSGVRHRALWGDGIVSDGMNTDYGKKMRTAAIDDVRQMCYIVTTLAFGKTKY